MAAKIQKNKTYSKLVCFDISENNLVVIELSFEKGNVYITGGFSLNLLLFQDLNHTISLINQNLRSSNIKTKDAVFSFSMQYFKLLPVPIPKSIPESEIGSILLQEANIDEKESCLSYLPLNIHKGRTRTGCLDMIFWEYLTRRKS